MIARPVEPGPWECPYHRMPGDRRFVRDRVDVLVSGSARSARPVPRIDVAVQVGTSWRARLVTYGPRVRRVVQVDEEHGAVTAHPASNTKPCRTSP